LHILWWVQFLPDAYGSLQFSVLWFSFTDPGGGELREREKEKKKIKKINRKAANWPAPSSQTFPACEQTGCLTLHWAVMLFKKLV
jgi:hypothetical protein